MSMSKPKRKSDLDFDAELEYLLGVLDQLDIAVKSDRGNFKGGLYRHNQQWIFYLNRKATPAEKVELILTELKSNQLPTEIINKIGNKVERVAENIF